jgi:hypothetical protein
LYHRWFRIRNQDKLTSHATARRSYVLKERGALNVCKNSLLTASDRRPIYERTAAEEMSNSVVIFNAPKELPLPDVLHTEAIVALGGCGRSASLVPPAADIYQPMPYSAAQTMADFLWPKGLHSY